MYKSCLTEEFAPSNRKRRHPDMAKLYDVFISHAGEDKDTIAAPVYRELARRGLQAFLDREELVAGGNAPKEMIQAMETTGVGLFILSPEFIAKNWTMKELFCFIRRLVEAEDQCCEPPILIPVFHRVSVADCRYGDLLAAFGDVFLKHHFFRRMENDEIKIKTVQEALNRLACFTGIENRGDLSGTMTATGSKEYFIHEICDAVCDAVRRRGGPASTRINRSSEKRSRVGGPVVSAEDQFVRTVYAPKNPKEVVLDFMRKNYDGSPLTTAGVVLEEVVCESDSAEVRVVSIEGMAGVGKSCVLRGIAWNERARRRFKDGIFHVSLGMDATMSTLICELLKVFRVSGARKRAETLRGESNLHLVVHELGEWFSGKRCLLLVDDIWKRNNLSEGLITELRNIFSDGSGSVLAFSTRFSNIAVAADTGCMVKLEARGTMSAESETILLEYSKFKKSDVEDRRVHKAFSDLLMFCKGLPVWLAAVGRGVAVIGMNMGSRRKGAWKEYWSMLRNTGRSGLKMNLEEYEDLEETLKVNVAVVEEYGQREIDFEAQYGLAEMHRAFCVFPKHAEVPASVLCRLWGLKANYQAVIILRILASGGLVEINMNDGGEVKMRLHDLIHDFVVAGAESRNERVTWHRRLLEGYKPGFETISIDFLRCAGRNRTEERDETAITYTEPWLCWLENDSRTAVDSENRRDNKYAVDVWAWWEMENDDYIYQNVCRHLVESENVAELLWLLLNVKWTRVRHRIGGILSWSRDFSWCIMGVEKAQRVSSNDREEVLRGLKLVRDAVCESWHFVSRREEFGFQVHGRLPDIENCGWAVFAYLGSVARNQSRPWLQPIQRCWNVPGKGGRHLTGSGECTISLVEAESKGIVGMPLQSHKGWVTSVAISGDGRYVISGAADETVCVREVESGKKICGPLRGHTDWVMCVAISGDGKYIVSGSYDRTVRVWELMSGRAIGAPRRNHIWPVRQIAISGNHVLSYDSAGNGLEWILDDTQGLIRPVKVSGSTRCLSKASEMPVRCCDREVRYTKIRVMPKDLIGGIALATLPSNVLCFTAWDYNADQRILVTGLRNGQVLCHKLIL